MFIFRKYDICLGNCENGDGTSDEFHAKCDVSSDWFVLSSASSKFYSFAISVRCTRNIFCSSGINSCVIYHKVTVSLVVALCLVQCVMYISPLIHLRHGAIQMYFDSFFD